MAKIEIITGDILRADVEALVNTVNCVGYMGRGIAAQFKKSFPANFKQYEATCKRNELKPGMMLVHETGTLTNPRYVVNFPTKRHWRGKSRLEDIEAGLVALVREVEARGITSVAVPPLGCGLGGLDWKDVRPRIERAFATVEGVRVVVFEPSGAPAAEDIRVSKNVPKMTPGRAVLVGLIERYLAGLLDPFVTLLEIHKLMYFAQAAGEPLRLEYRAAAYGPYAENLRHVLAAVEGHFIVGYADGGDAPEKEISLVPGAIEDAKAVLAEQHETQLRFERVAALVDGFESPFGLELLATVHWVVKHGAAREAVVEAVHGWNDRKKSMNARQIQLALARLEELGWLPTA
ncbi:MAG: macro domain-containing protein [Deltaproteobacteria bacterium]|nr:macro domain-containing protein [Deltaproteobacteria bacterium]